MSFFLIHVKEGIGFLRFILFLCLKRFLNLLMINVNTKRAVCYGGKYYTIVFYFRHHNIIMVFEMLLVTVAWRLNKPIRLQISFSL